MTGEAGGRSVVVRITRAAERKAVAREMKAHFMAILDLMQQLPQEELRAIRSYEFSEMFAWWDSKHFYLEQSPMMVAGEPMGHGEAMWLQLALQEMLEVGELDEDVCAYICQDDDE